MLGKKRKQVRIYTLKHYFRSFIEDDKRFIIKAPVADDLSAGILAVEVRNRNVAEAS